MSDCGNLQEPMKSILYKSIYKRVISTLSFLDLGKIKHIKIKKRIFNFIVAFN